MAYRQPDVSISFPYWSWRSEKRIPVGSKINEYLSSHGVMLSKNDLRFWIRTTIGGETTYHVGGNTVLVVFEPKPYPDPKSYDLKIFVEGAGKSELVKELEYQLAEFRIPAKA